MFKFHANFCLLRGRTSLVGGLFGALFGVLFLCVPINLAFAQLSPEPVPNNAVLPNKIPQSWIFAHDASFYSLTTGKVMLIDTLAKTRNIRGMIGAAQFASFRQSKKRNELYVAESFFSRGTRGEQVDVLTIYETNTLRQKGEIILPGNKRFQVVTQKAALQLTKDEQFALVFNFTPASSVTIVDLKNRKVVNEIDVAGCMLTYPLGQRGFMTLCGDGTLLAVNLDYRGQVSSKKKSQKFHDVTNDPLFMKAAWHNGIAYFTSFKGMMQAVDLRSNKPKIMKPWQIPNNHPMALPSARPSGWQIISADTQGHIYVLMRANAGDGDHKFGGGAIYQLDAKTQNLVDVIELNVDGFSIEATKGKNAVLTVTNIDMQLDVFDLATKAKLRTIAGWGPAMPLALHGAN